MVRTSVLRKWRPRVTLGLLLTGLMSIAIPASSQGDIVDAIADHQRTATPIKHVIVLIGENRTFDHLFATYVPRSRDSIKNLLSEGIIKADGSPGRHFAKARQFLAIAPFKQKYFISLNDSEKVAYRTLPAPTLNFSPSPVFPYSLDNLEPTEPVMNTTGMMFIKTVLALYLAAIALAAPTPKGSSNFDDRSTSSARIHSIK